MKKTYTFLLLALISFGLNAQNKLYLQINHKLNNQDFSPNLIATNNLENSFTITRLEYYIAEITLHYNDENTKDTTLSNLWILANANINENHLLGSFLNTDVQSISFSIGVQKEFNHLDPSEYFPTHPLSPKSPSMHWGWAAGYRFAALEGKTGEELNSIFELHALGDDNYFRQTVEVNGLANGSDWVIAIEADYANALKDINVTPDLINHAEDGPSRDMLINFRDNVFSKGNVKLSIKAKPINIGLYPNPTLSNSLITINNSNIKEISIFDIQGKLIDRQLINNNTLAIPQLKTGLYFLKAFDKNGFIGTTKLQIQ